MGWLSGWQYRKSHVANSASGAGTNYQIKVKAHYGSGSDSGEDVYLNSHCRTDFGDVRFTDDDGSTLLDYWMEEKVDSDYAVFWVEVADDLSSNNATIYIYYGKSDATTTSSGNNAFIFFDDFDDGSIDTSKWDYQAGTGGSVVEADGVLKITAPSSNGQHTWVLSDNLVFLTNKMFEARLKRYNSAGQHFNAGGTEASPLGSYYTLVSAATWLYSNFYYAQNGGSGESLAQDDAVDTNFHIWSIGRNSTTDVRYFKDRTLDETISTNVPSQDLKAYFRCYKHTGTAQTIHVDWIFIRKYVVPEPSHGSWGSEESEVTTYTKTWQADVLFKKLGITKTAAVDATFKKPDIAKTFGLDSAFMKSSQAQKQVDALFKRFDILKQFGIDVGFLKKNIIKSFAINARFGAIQTYIISKQIDTLFKKFGITKGFSVDADFRKTQQIQRQFNALFRKSITTQKQIDVLFKKYNMQKTFAVDIWIGIVGAVTYTKAFSIDVVFRYKVKLPTLLGITPDGQLVIPIKRDIWIGN